MKTRIAKTEYARALDLLTQYLALRDHSRHELQQKMSRKFEPTLIQQVIAEADANGWIPPEVLIAERAAQVWNSRLKSRSYIEGQLRKRHLPLPPSDLETEATKARELIEKKYGPPSELNDEDKSKAYRFMKYRGFDDHTIRMVLNGQDF